MDTEYLKKRFGTIAVEKKLITEEQLYDAIIKQISEDLEGRERRQIGSILYNLSHLSISQINEVLEFQKKEKGIIH